MTIPHRIAAPRAAPLVGKAKPTRGIRSETDGITARVSRPPCSESFRFYTKN